MAKAQKTKKANTKKTPNLKERASVAVARALDTRKEYPTTMGLLLSSRLFLRWLLGVEDDRELAKLRVSCETGFAFRPGKNSILPATVMVTCAANTTGRGDTIKVVDTNGTVRERVFFPSPKMKGYEGFNFGRPMLKKMTAVLGLPEATLCQKRQGNKNFWYNEDVTLLAEYFRRAYGQKTKK